MSAGKSEDEGERAPAWVTWGVVLLLAVICSLAIESVTLRPVSPRILYWPAGPDVLPVVSADGRSLVARGTVNPPGRDLVAALDELGVRPRWTSAFTLSIGPRRQLSVVGPHVVAVVGPTVHFLDAETGRAVRTVTLPDTTDGFCVAPEGDAIWVRLLSGESRRVSSDGAKSVGARPGACRHHLRPHDQGGLRVHHDGVALEVVAPGWRWRGASRGEAGPWPSGAWDRGAGRIFLATLTEGGPGIEVLEAETGRHLHRVGVAAGGKVPRFTLFGDTLIVPHKRRWDLYSVETGRKTGRHPTLRR